MRNAEVTLRVVELAQKTSRRDSAFWIELLLELVDSRQGDAVVRKESTFMKPGPDAFGDFVCGGRANDLRKGFVAR